MCGLAGRSSDLDLTFTPDFRKRLSPSEREPALRTISTALRSSGKHMQPPWRTEIILHARIPIVRISAGGGVEIDISLENDLPVYKSEMMKQYSLIDPRFPKLVKLIKSWAKARKINSAKHGTLNSFSLSLMVLHFLQQVEPPVLPMLPRLNQEMSNFPPLLLGECNGMPIQTYTNEHVSDWPGSSDKRNTDPLPMLLHQLLRYFAREFQWDTMCVSVVQGSVPKSSVVLKPGQGTAIIIHDPLEQVPLSCSRAHLHHFFCSTHAETSSCFHSNSPSPSLILIYQDENCARNVEKKARLIIQEFKRAYSLDLEEFLGGVFPKAGESLHRVQQIAPTSDSARLYTCICKFACVLSL